jgi:Respiratory-chain NADH dehydrogenase, 49 Kd subunit
MVLILPDEQSWTVLGADSTLSVAQPTWNPEAATVVLAPNEVPDGLAASLAEYRELLPDRVRVEYRELPIPGRTSVRHLLDRGHPAPAQQGAQGQGHAADERGHAEHEHSHDSEHQHSHADDEHEHSEAVHEHGHGGHHDMMAIVGEPSADGLVMESIELTYGPLGTPLPGGLAIDVTLDGDVVAASAVHALMRADPLDSGRDFPDALSPVAWMVALAGTGGWLDIAAVELERAISHVAWLRSLGRLLDWEPMVDACAQGLASLQVSREVQRPGRADHDTWLRAAFGSPDLAAGREALEEIVALLGRSRALRWRLRGRGVVTGAEAQEVGLLGPVGRASGRPMDARSTDARYAALGFDPVVRGEGDALARAVVRAEEALASVRLADAALNEDSAAPAADRVVEGPRGPLHVRGSAGRSELDAPGADAARAAAAGAMVGLEWSAALVALASFDLSPWSVGS